MNKLLRCCDKAIAQEQTNTPVNPTNTLSGTTLTLCAQENGVGGTSWYYRAATNSIACNSSTFGDPIRGTVKACYYSPNGPPGHLVSLSAIQRAEVSSGGSRG